MTNTNGIEKDIKLISKIVNGILERKRQYEPDQTIIIDAIVDSMPNIIFDSNRSRNRYWTRCAYNKYRDTKKHLNRKRDQICSYYGIEDTIFYTYQAECSSVYTMIEFEDAIKTLSSVAKKLLIFVITTKEVTGGERKVLLISKIKKLAMENKIIKNSTEWRTISKEIREWLSTVH